MNQLTQKLKDGKMQVLDVPIPVLQKNQILVKNYYSLISAGTEGSTVKTARKGFIGKAKERPQQVKQVIDTLKTQGITQTYRAVMKKLDAYSSLGYSCAGEVVDLGSDISGIKIGDMVACGGLTACHAEVVSVPANLCVKLQPDADMKQAAYNTLGAIAMQGVRQIDLRLGETCAVIGLGLLGQLAALLLKASGIRVIGIDIDQAMVETGKKHCLDLALNRNESGIEDRIFSFTNGIGCDGVIIAASSGSLDPVNFAGAIARKKGTIVVLGAVPTGFDREPYFYKKELQIKMSCSYGPGRYDPVYEEKGLDYPAAYVRWTENRNMQAFQELIYHNKIDVSYLTSHTFKLEDAPLAYDMMMEKAEPFIGILIEYNPQVTQIIHEKIEVKSSAKGAPPAVSIGFIGAGSYAQSHLLPNIPTNDNVFLKGVMTATSTGSISAAERFGFEFCAGNENDILKNNDINTVFIATRHDSHADYVIKALNAGKNVFVEKPLCLTIEGLEEISSLYNSKLKTQNSHLSLMVGYNRRFAPLADRIKKEFGDGPMSMTYRINAGKIPSDSWIQDMEIGGGRIIGEVCHFVDFLTFINGSLPVSVYAAVLREPENLNDILNITLSYKNGSIGTISYFANGDKSLPKERVEIFYNGCTAILDDFKVLAIHAKGKKKVKKLMSQDKGQKKEVQAFINSRDKACLVSTDNIISFDEIYSASLVTFKILESIRTG
ncbi:MAG: bi-domain-containing oxidoreductase, partial [Desulfosarcina sp.]|nr:bi-domain-containing oxidoreductase [Desulfobacterales bacterium]